MRAATKHDEWLRAEHARQVAEAERRKELEKKRKQDEEFADAIRSLLHWTDKEPSHGVQLGSPDDEPPIDRFAEDRYRRLQRERHEAAAEEASRPRPVQHLLARKKTATPKEAPLPAEVSRAWQWPITIAALGVFAAIVFVVPLQQ